MKDVLNKLPGIKTDKNIIKIQGKTVTKLLVEGESFFDGSTKLALSNRKFMLPRVFLVELK